MTHLLHPLGRNPRPELIVLLPHCQAGHLHPVLELLLGRPRRGGSLDAVIPVLDVHELEAAGHVPTFCFQQQEDLRMHEVGWICSDCNVIGTKSHDRTFVL